MEKFNDNLSQFTDIIKKLYPDQKTAIEDTFSELKKVAEAPNFKQKSISEKKKILSKEKII